MSVNRRWKCVCAYDGSAFSGWQSQVCGTAVQDVLETRLQTIFKRPVRIHGSGRTDSGVHARGQVFHFDAEWKAGERALLLAINNGLPPELRIMTAEQVSEDFHARFSVTGKEYRYQILTRPADPFEHRYWWFVHRAMNPARIQEGIEALQGTHDFTSFAAGVEEGDNPVKTLRSIRLLRNDPYWTLCFEGSGFLYKMVRSLTGALVYVGQGRLAVSRLTEILHEKKRTEEVYTAPAHGLFLETVEYGEERQSGRVDSSTKNSH